MSWQTDLSRLVEHYGSPKEVSRRLGNSSSTLGHWIAGKAIPGPTYRTQLEALASDIDAQRGPHEAALAEAQGEIALFAGRLQRRQAEERDLLDHADAAGLIALQLAEAALDLDEVPHIHDLARRARAQVREHLDATPLLRPVRQTTS